MFLILAELIGQVLLTFIFLLMMVIIYERVMKIHEAVVPSNQEPEFDSVHGGRRVYLCDDCEKEFSRPKDLEPQEFRRLDCDCWGIYDAARYLVDANHSVTLERAINVVVRACNTKKIPFQEVDGVVSIERRESVRYLDYYPNCDDYVPLDKREGSQE